MTDETDRHARTHALSRTSRSALVTIALVVLVFALRETAFIVVPLSMAIFGAILVWPLQRGLRSRLPGPVAITLTTLVVLGSIAAGAVAIFLTFSDFVKSLPTYSELFRGTSWPIRKFLPSPAEMTDNITNSLAGAAQGLAAQAAFVALTLTFLITLVGESSTWQVRLESLLSERQPGVRKSLANVATFFRSYMLIHTLVSLLTGCLSALICWAFGVRDPHVWGLLTFFLNYIPNVGSIIAVIPPAIVAYAEINPKIGVSLFFVLGTLQFLIGNWFEPWVLGRNFQLSALVALVAVVFWSWVWGIGGAIIAVPLTILMLAVAREVTHLRWISDLVTSRDPPKRHSLPGAPAPGPGDA